MITILSSSAREDCTAAHWLTVYRLAVALTFEYLCWITAMLLRFEYRGAKPTVYAFYGAIDWCSAKLVCTNAGRIRSKPGLCACTCWYMCVVFSVLVRN